MDKVQYLRVLFNKTDSLVVKNVNLAFFLPGYLLVLVLMTYLAKCIFFVRNKEGPCGLNFSVLWSYILFQMLSNILVF